MQSTPLPCGFYASLHTFLASDETSWLSSMTAFHLRCMNMPPGAEQVSAWRHSYLSLKQNLPKLITKRIEAADWYIIFEYELPRERGRRPDVVILAGETILVLEYKDTAVYQKAHIDQVSAYARDLRNYHSASHNCPVFPILVLTKAFDLVIQHEDVFINSPETLPVTIMQLTQGVNSESQDAIAWLTADYAPLPSLVSAARTIFHNEPLPYIRRARSAGIPDTISTLIRAADLAETKGQHHLALVTGVPGAGKTLVGLQFVYDNHFNTREKRRTALFLSGNGPLVKVLQHALKSSVFVQDVHGFLKQYGGSSRFLPEENIYVFDEAQRAWDTERVIEKRGHSHSEPLDFLKIGEKKNWTLMVGLIGDGQEIHLGEEAGLSQWNEAIACSNAQWIVHCPAHISSIFSAARGIEISEHLNLTASLRSHLAEDVQKWVNFVLEGDFKKAKSAAEKVRSQGFDMYITQDLSAAKSYVLSRYKGEEEKRFGLLASSKAKNLERNGVNNSWNFTKNLREGPWFNDPSTSRYSCCQLNDVATEFSCQGLELDFPIVCWGDDLRWSGTYWQTPPSGPRSKAKNPRQLRINSYRVLLSRGRDGFVIYLPSDPSMQQTFQILQQSGLTIL